MTTSAAPVVRVLLLLLAVVLLAVGLTLGYVAVIAARRSEGVFMPAGYVALACLAGGAFLLRAGLRG
jgi:uncharacterized protein (UPF0333 family)